MNKKMYKLTNPQKNIWNMEFYFNDTNICNICSSGLIKENVDIDTLKKAVNILVQKNDSFRIHLTLENGEPFQYFVDFKNFDIEVVECGSTDDFRKLEHTLVKEKFQLFNSDLFKFKLAKLPNGNVAVVLNIHHIISDSWSLGITIQEIVRIYHSLMNGVSYVSPTFSYTDFINSEEEYIHTKKFEKDKAFWTDYLQEVSQAVSMPSVNGLSHTPSASHDSSNDGSKVSAQEASRSTYFLGNDLMDRINSFCKEHKLSTYSFFMSVISLYLANSANTNDVVIGTPILNRTNFKEKNSTGMFISTVPFRSHIVEIDSFVDFATRTTVDLMSVFRHQKYSYVNIVEDIREQNSDISNLYHVAVSYQITRASNDIDGCETNWTFNGMGIDELTVHIYDLNDTGNLKIDYDFLTSKYSKEEVDSWHLRILHMIEQVLDNPSICLKDLQYITDEEKSHILFDFNKRVLNCPLDSNIIALFENQVVDVPDELALVYKKKSYTYIRLNCIVNQFARYLRSRGVRHGDIVGVYMNKSDWFIISILAIQKLGGAYLPMHPDYPEDRVSYILQDSNSRVLVTDQDIRLDGITLVHPARVNLTHLHDTNLNVDISSSDLCYVIYTSGSTGKPKGVCLTHSNLVNFLYNLDDCFTNSFSKEDNCLSVANISFDASVQEIFAPLCFGATLVLYPKNTLTNIPLLCDVLEENNITFSFIPPNILDDIYYFVKTNHRDFTINKLSVGVETIKNSTLNHFYELNPNIEIVNGYGPSEATICSTFYTYHYNPENSTVPIGFPLKNNDIYILNFLGQLQPVGFPGEICVSGASVSVGYLNNPEMTSKSFVHIPYLTDRAIYKTGDIGFWHEAGYVSFIGRNDTQIKYRGHRVELNEINNSILTMQNVTNSVTIFKKINDVPAICCYVATSDTDITPETVRTYLSEHLPYYMIPSHIMILDSLPLTANGKIDRKNLPYIDVKPKVYVKPSTLTEIKLHNMVCKLLHLDNFSIYDNFFELGMDSLLAIRLSLEIYYEFDKNLTITDIFQNNTIALLSAVLDGDNETQVSYDNIVKASAKSSYELSSAQKRIYYASKKAGSSSLIYNVSGGFFINGFLDVKKVEKAINKVVSKNSAFRTYFSNQDGEIKQFVLDNCQIKVNCFDDGMMSPEDIQVMVDNFPKYFDLDFAPLLRVELHHINDKSLLLIDSHHIILDGSSLNIFISDFCKAYANEEIEEKELVYTDYSEWENAYLSSKQIESVRDYWVNRFEGYEIPVMNLPYDYTVSGKKSYNGDKLSFDLGEDIFNNISKIANDYDMSNYMVFLAGLYLLFYIYTGQENIIIGSPMEARHSAKLNNLIGMFVNNLILNARIDGNLSVENLLHDVKDMVLSTLSHQPYPSDMLLKDLKIPANASLFDVVFAYQNANTDTFYLNKEKLEILFANTHTAKFPLTIEIVPSSYKINFEYNTDLFREETVRGLFDHYMYILKNMKNYLQKSIDEIEIITDSENLLLRSFNQTDKPINNDTVVSIFEDVVLHHVDDIAVICDDKTLTYNELNKKANCLAHHLIGIGIRPNDIVCIMTNRSLETIVCMLGILKAGAAFLNVDPTYPIDRTQYYLQDCKAQYVLTQRCLMDKVSSIPNCIEIDLDSSIYDGNGENPYVKVAPMDLSYVIYTSGSTGLPKGVLLHQAGFANMVKAMGYVLDYLKEGNKHCIASVTSTPFDIFVYEIFVSLSYGMKVLMANNDEHRNPILLDGLIRKYGADVMTVTPSLMKINYDNRLHPSALSNIKHMVFGGEPLPEKFVQDLRKFSEGVTIYNIYGPSEITVLSNVQNLTGENQITVGPPIMNTQIHILDKNMHRVPIGVVGEIYISGIQVGLGYLGKPEMTAAKFLDNPFGEGKMYKSGDIGRWTFDGKVQCLGRIDNQIKLRGLRIELGEIEGKMEQITGVISAVVNKVSVSGREFLCGYYVCDREIDVDEKDVKAILRKSLPPYMVPTYIVKLDKMPYTINRKIDRKALPMPDLNSNHDYIVEEKLTRREKQLLNIWKNILHVDNISVDDNFFDIGGDSISAINMQIEALREGFRFEYADIFNYPSVKLLAAKVNERSGGSAGVSAGGLANSSSTDGVGGLAYSQYDEIKEYDYTQINKLLANNTEEAIQDVKDVPLGNVLLIGVTGYLGSHLIYSFLKNETGDIYCLIRQKDNIIPHARLKNTLSYYFGKGFYETYQDRIHIVEGDISKDQLGLSDEDYETICKNVTTVINSGALVKHYGQRKLFEKVNVQGTRNVVEVCRDLNKRLLHISTISISGNGEREEMIVETPENISQKKVFSEKDLYIGQKLNNVYTLTKFEAERIVLEAILNGLDAQILRVGNIVSRYSDGMFQRNIEENSFAKRIKSFIDIGVFPEYSLQHAIEMTPVDLCANAILQVGKHSSKAHVFHIYNTKLLSLQLFVDTLAEMDIKLLPVSNSEMTNIITQLLEDDNRKEILSGIIHDLDKDKQLIYTSNIRLNSDFTENYLNFIGFHWKCIDKNYIIRYINYFRKIKFL